MSVVKDEVSGAEETEVPGAEEAEVAGAEEKNQLEIMSDSKLPDDWSIIGPKCVDNDGSDGESVEIIPCEEEETERLPEETSQKVETLDSYDKIIQTDEIVQCHNFLRSYPGVVLFSVICHLLIAFLYLAGSNDRVQIPNLGDTKLPTTLRPAFVELIEDWREISPRSTEDKALILSFLRHYFPLETFDDEIIALLEKDIDEKPNLASIHRKRLPLSSLYHPSNLPDKRLPLSSLYRPSTPSAKDQGPKIEPTVEETVENKAKPFPDDKNACQNCKSGNCKKFCKQRKGKGLKYYYDKALNTILKTIPKFKNRKP